MYLINFLKDHFKFNMSKIKVPFIDLKLRYKEEKTDLNKAIEKVISRGNLVLTQEVKELEQDIEKYTKSKHCISLNSGTDALMMALWAADIKRGDEIIQPPISFVATTGATIHVGAKPVYCDVGNDQLIDVNKIEELITNKTKAIMPVHWAGKICDMDKIMEIARKYKLKVIEDSAQSMGTYYKKKHGGTIGLAGAISCHPLKNLNALGDGGLLLTNSSKLAKRVRLMRNHGLESRDNVVLYGVNSRLDSLNAQVLRMRLKKLANIIKRRRKNAKLYQKLISRPEIKFIKTPNDRKDGFVMFIVLAKKRDLLQKYLNSQGIESIIYYGTPLHLHKAAKNFGYKKGDFPEAEKQCSEVLALPHHQHLTEDQIFYVANKINKFYD